MKHFALLDTENPGYAIYIVSTYDDSVPSIPGIFEIPSSRPEGQFTLRWNLETLVWEVPFLILVIIEREWRNRALYDADIPTLLAQDSNHKAVGTLADWQTYKNALRDWPEHPEFPNTDFRPQAPTAIVEEPEEPEEPTDPEPPVEPEEEV